ncbi:MAG: hypothetical protein HY735_25885 [Verrucomicrobia bacterium]|nr:hypothetical protein [Verrucomicrobiota bacterium]
MFGSDVVDAAIGLFLVYFLFSLLCSTINELIVGHLGELRSRTLRIAGSLVAAGALSLGAPFWFDLLTEATVGWTTRGRFVVPPLGGPNRLKPGLQTPTCRSSNGLDNNKFINLRAAGQKPATRKESEPG